MLRIYFSICLVFICGVLSATNDKKDSLTAVLDSNLILQLTDHDTINIIPDTPSFVDREEEVDSLTDDVVENEDELSDSQVGYDDSMYAPCICMPEHEIELVPTLPKRKIPLLKRIGFGIRRLF